MARKDQDTVRFQLSARGEWDTVLGGIRCTAGSYTGRETCVLLCREALSLLTARRTVWYLVLAMKGRQRHGAVSDNPTMRCSRCRRDALAATPSSYQ